MGLKKINYYDNHLNNRPLFIDHLYDRNEFRARYRKRFEVP